MSSPAFKTFLLLYFQLLNRLPRILVSSHIENHITIDDVKIIEATKQNDLTQQQKILTW